ncbi:hypothetical protein BDR03DRAFT_870103, partial [Suillus americanus]
ELKLHLQSIGKFICAQDLIDFLGITKNHTCLRLTKLIPLRTAQHWMLKLGYCWTKEPQGQYADGHEQDDIVYYHQNIFLPMWSHYQSRMQTWKHDEVTIEDLELHGAESGCCVVVWFHDELTFYASDCRWEHWVHTTEKAVPLPKGEGASLMVVDFVLADYGWLHS